MEDMNMTNEIVCTEAMEDIADAIPVGNSGLKSVVKVGGIAAGAVLAWEFVIKPIGRKVQQFVTDKAVARKVEKAKAIDPDDVDLDDIPEID